MSIMAPEVEIVEDPDQLELPFEFEDFEIPCDVRALWTVAGKTGVPPCPDDPAHWIAWRTCACGLKHRLVCDHCKAVYERWEAYDAHIVCADCNEAIGPIHYVPLVS